MLTSPLLLAVWAAWTPDAAAAPLDAPVADRPPAAAVRSGSLPSPFLPPARGPERSTAGTDARVIDRDVGDEQSPTDETDAKLKALAHHMLDARILFDDRPEYVGKPPERSGIGGDDAPVNPRLAAVKNLGEKEFYRTLRSRLKSQWRGQFQGMPNMSYEFYETRLFQIDEIGRYEEEKGDYYANQVQENVFRRSEVGEKEIQVLKLGPLVLLDSGSVAFDASLLGQVFGIRKDDRPPVELAPDHRPLAAGKNYKIDTRFRVNSDPLRALSGNPADAIRSVGVAVEVRWLTDILRRERFTTEAEVQLGPGGDSAFFFNFILKTW